MKTKKTNKVNSALLLLLLFSAGVHAQMKKSTAFNAVNKVSVATPVIVSTPVVAAEQSMTTTAAIDNSNFVMLKDEPAEMQSSNFAGTNNLELVKFYTYNLCLIYAVPTEVYWDWKYVHDQAMDLYVNYYMYSDGYDQNRLMNLALNDFTCYSKYVGFQQTLEFRAGTGATFQYWGDKPPVMPNYNPILVTKTFSAP